MLAEAPEQFVARTMVLPCVDDATGIRIDIIFSRSEYEQQALGRAVTIQVGSTGVRFASAEDLLVHKIIAGRPRDIEDARSIMLRNPQLDMAYARRWLGLLGTAIDEDLLARLEVLLSDLKS